MPGLVVAICAPTVLPAPPVAMPLAVELFTVPTGKLEIGMRPGEKFAKAAFAPTKPPTMLLAPPVTAPVDVELSMVPRFSPANPPRMLLAPVAVTAPLATEGSIQPMLTAAKPPRMLLEVPVTVLLVVESKMTPPL